MMHRAYTFLDIETRPNPALLDRVPSFSAPKNYKDPDKIAEYEKSKREEFVDGMALDLDYAVISAIGLGRGFESRHVLIANDVAAERKALRILWKELNVLNYGDFFVCGFNILEFDLPIILRRSWVLGVRPTVSLDINRYNAQIVDLMQILYHRGYGPGPKYRGLKYICELCGIPNAYPELNGALAPNMSPEELAVYCRNDILLLQLLAEKMLGWYL
jgi:hypothetical protein